MKVAVSTVFPNNATDILIVGVMNFLLIIDIFVRSAQKNFSYNYIPWETNMSAMKGLSATDLPVKITNMIVLLLTSASTELSVI